MVLETVNVTFGYMFMGHCFNDLSNLFRVRNNGTQEGLLECKGVSRGSIKGAFQFPVGGRRVEPTQIISEQQGPRFCSAEDPAD